MWLVGVLVKLGILPLVRKGPGASLLWASPTPTQTQPYIYNLTHNHTQEHYWWYQLSQPLYDVCEVYDTYLVGMWIPISVLVWVYLCGL